MNRMRTAERICRKLAIIAVILVMLMQAGEHNGIAQRVAAGAALLAIIVDAVLSWQLGKQAAAAQESAPKQTAFATVVSRRTTHRWIMHGGRAVSSSGRDAWYVSFRTAGGDILEFETPYDVYEHAGRACTAGCAIRAGSTWGSGDTSLRIRPGSSPG